MVLALTLMKNAAFPAPLFPSCSLSHSLAAVVCMCACVHIVWEGGVFGGWGCSAGDVTDEE